MEDMKSMGAVKISKEETPMSKVKVASSYIEIYNNKFQDWGLRLL